MKTTSLLLFISFLSIYGNAQEWIKVYKYGDSSDFTSSYINEIQFVNSNVGFFSTYQITQGSAPGDAHLYKTINIGKDWVKIYTQGGVMGSRASISFDFLDEKNFFIFKSYDGELHHGRLFIDSIGVNYGFTPYSPPYVRMLNADTIILSHFSDDNINNIYLLTPANGELNRIPITDDYIFVYPYWGNQDVIKLVSFVDGFGAAIGTQGVTKFFYSSNSFSNIWKKDTLKIEGSISKLYFKNCSVGFIVCNDTTLYRTHNSGIEWHKVKLPDRMPIKGIEFSHSKGFIISTNGRIATSTDDGVEWVINSVNSAGSFVKLTTVNDIAYVLDDNGQLFTNNHFLSATNLGLELVTIELFPNPVSFELHIKSSINIQNLKIYNSLGILVNVYSQINSDTFILNTAELPKGIYYLQFISEVGFSTKKIIKN